MLVGLRMSYKVRRPPPCPRVMAAEGNRSGQALTGVNMGQVLSFENSRGRGADGLPVYGRQHSSWRQWQVMTEPRGVIDPEHAFLYNMYGTWEIPATSGGLVFGQSGRRR